MPGKRGHAKGADAAAIVDNDEEIARDHRRIADAELSSGDSRGERAS
jgi:hypothetical protein